ncbi:MAG: PIG-L family deacetylase [Archangiaceae bacterium]|nr:PIG-L family deacetylase [Archangiaceae bacterium]
MAKRTSTSTSGTRRPMRPCAPAHAPTVAPKPEQRKPAAAPVAAFTAAPATPPAPKSADFYKRMVDSVRAGAPSLPPIPSLPVADLAPSSGPRNVVMYVAHPDDETGYAGGTLKKLADAGHAVTAVSLTHGEGGRIVEERGGEVVELRAPADFPVAKLVRARDAEMSDAAGRMGIEHAHLFDAKLGLDYGYTRSTAEVLTRWDTLAPGGLDGMLSRMVADLRARKPDLVLALMESNPEEHGAHKASAILVDLAARLAADPSYGSGAPHVVRELVIIGSAASHDLRVDVDKDAWRHTMGAYRTQFLEPMISETDHFIRGDDTSHEQYTVRWSAHGAVNPAGESLFASLTGL